MVGVSDSERPAARSASGRPRDLARKLVKFCLVGTSGVGVNMAVLWLAADLAAVHTNVASALAIEVSIISNFLLNDAWTFRDQRHERPFAARLTRFHVVSLLGAAIQWSIFVLCNALVYMLLLRPGEAALGLFDAIIAPPDVGGWKYASQLCGIALATSWNFLANAFWTWKTKAGAKASE